MKVHDFKFKDDKWFLDSLGIKHKGKILNPYLEGINGTILFSNTNKAHITNVNIPNIADYDSFLIILDDGVTYFMPKTLKNIRLFNAVGSGGREMIIRWRDASLNQTGLSFGTSTNYTIVNGGSMTYDSNSSLEPFYIIGFKKYLFE